MSGDTASWMDAIPRVAPPPALMTPDSSATPPPRADALSYPSYPMVPSHPAPDGSGAMINMSDDDYGKFMQGIAPPTGSGVAPKKEADDWTSSIPRVQAPPGMVAAQSDNKAAAGAGLKANFAAGSNRAIFGVVGAPVDVVTGALNLIPRTINSITGHTDPGTGVPLITNPVGGSDWISQKWGVLTGVNPQTVQPTTEAERIAGAAGGAIAQLPLMAMGGMAGAGLKGVPGAVARTVADSGGVTPGQIGEITAATGGGGAAGQLAEDKSPDALKPVANLAGNLAGAGGVLAAVRGGQIAGRAYGNQFSKQVVAPGISATPNQQSRAFGQVSDALGPQGFSNVEAANAAELRARELETQLAAPGISDADRVAAQRELNGLADQRMNAVPGSDPTLSQVAPNPDIKALENQSKQLYNPQYVARQDVQNNAQLAAVRGAGGTGEGASVGRFFTDQLDRMNSENAEYMDSLEQQHGERLNAAQTAGDQRLGDLDASLRGATEQQRAALDAEGQQGIGQAAQRVQAASEGVGGGTDPDTMGENIRTPLAEREAAATGRVSAMYDAIDPENKLVVDKTPAIQAAQAIRREFGPGQWGNLPPELAPVKYWVDKIAGSNDPAQRFNDFGRDLQFLGKDITSLRMKGIDPKSTTGHYLGILKTAMRNSIEETIDRAAASDSGLVERLKAYGESNPEGGSGSGAAASSSGGTPGVVGPRGNTGHGSERPGGVTGTGGVAATGSTRRPESLIDWVIAKGGVRDDRGDLKSAGLDVVHHQRGGRLINPNGTYADDLAQQAHSEGFPTPDLNAFKDALGQDWRSRDPAYSEPPVYRSSDMAEGTVRTQQARQAAQDTHDRFMATANIDQAASDLGVRLSPEAMAHATEMHLVHKIDPETAVREATRAEDEDVFQRNAEHNAVGAPGVPLGARQAEMPVSASQLTPNITAEDAAKIAAARRAHAEKKETFWQGPVGAALKGGPTYGSYSLENANVAKQFLNGQPTEPGRVQKFIEAVGGAPQAVDAMREALVADLRVKGIIGEDGMVDAGGLKNWLRPDKRGRTVDLFPGLREQLGDVESAQRTYDDTVAAHNQRIADFNKQAAADHLARIGAAKAEVKSGIADIAAENKKEVATAKADQRDQLGAFNQAAGHFTGNADPVQAIGKLFNASTRNSDVADVLARARDNPEVLDGLKHLASEYIERKFGTGRPTDPEGDFSARMFNAKAYRDFLDKNSEVLKRIYGGQGYQNLYGVGADMRRQLAATEAQASPGPDTARKLAGMAKSNAPAHGGSLGTTAFAIIGENLAESAAHAIGGTGLIGLAAKAGGVLGGVLLHRLRQAGIETTNDLVREMLMNPKFTLEMRAKVANNKLSPMTAKRIASTLRSAVLADQANSTGTKQ